MITNVSPKKRLKNYQLSRERPEESVLSQMSPEARENSEKRHEILNNSVEGSVLMDAASVDRSKEGIILDSTHKNILKLGSRQTTEMGTKNPKAAAPSYHPRPSRM